jgi:hypothetical protein
MAAENRGPELAAVVIFLVVLSIITVCLRCFTRRVLLKVFFVEDWLALVTLVRFQLSNTRATQLIARSSFSNHLLIVNVE